SRGRGGSSWNAGEGLRPPAFRSARERGFEGVATVREGEKVRESGSRAEPCGFRAHRGAPRSTLPEQVADLLEEHFLPRRRRRSRSGRGLFLPLRRVHRLDHEEQAERDDEEVDDL